MSKEFYKDALGWGFALWLVGYLLGMILFFIVPPDAIGWFIAPIGILITLWVLLRKIKTNPFDYYLRLAIIWTLLAIALDYIFIVKLLHAINYYKPDVYLYYISIFILPPLAYQYKKSTQR